MRPLSGFSRRVQAIEIRTAGRRIGTIVMISNALLKGMFVLTVNQLATIATRVDSVAELKANINVLIIALLIFGSEKTSIYLSKVKLPHLPNSAEKLPQINITNG
jgi:hypothetical protein